MLADPRSEALAKNFAGQWLRLRNISGALPSDVIFPDFGESLRQDFVRETELFFDSVMREDRSVSELLTADYTFLNERLARHYGVTGVYGSDFRRVALTDPNRRGLLGQGSILTVTSYLRPHVAGRPRQVGAGERPRNTAAPAAAQRAGAGAGRGLGQGAGDARAHGAAPREPGLRELPPADGSAGAGPGELRCDRPLARSHAGRRSAIDASGSMPDGTPFDGPADLRELLVRNPEQFVTVVTEKLLDLRARPRRGVLRRAGRPGDYPCGGRARLRTGVAHRGRRPEHAVPDAAGEDRRCRQLNTQPKRAKRSKSIAEQE